jgi:hypothetical protein
MFVNFLIIWLLLRVNLETVLLTCTDMREKFDFFLFGIIIHNQEEDVSNAGPLHGY